MECPTIYIPKVKLKPNIESTPAYNFDHVFP